MTKLSRRAVLAVVSLATVPIAARLGFIAAQPIEEVHDLKPGQFVWHPERSASGPVAIIVSIPDQLVHVYRNGIRIGVSTCSTGKPGHATPTGVFMILQKDKDHRSSTYDDAPMPNMDRLTWSGVALHAGNLPGYPASHGCIRLPLKFSALLFGVVHVGSPVIVAGAASAPFDVTHPGLVLASDAENEMASAHATVTAKADPWGAQVDKFSDPLAIVVSGADRTAIVMQDGNVVAQGSAQIQDAAQALGSHVFVLTGTAAGSMSWQGISNGASPRELAAGSETTVLKRITVDKSVVEAMRPRLHLGTVLVTTDLPAQSDTRTGRDFVVMGVES